MLHRDPYARPQLLCLDFDGTLVDTQALWVAAYQAVADARSHPLTPGWWQSIAGKSMDASAGVFDVYDRQEQQLVAKQLVESAATLVAVHPPQVFPGAAKLFTRAINAQIPVCVVTSTWTGLATALATSAGFPPVTVVGGDQVVRGKPSGDIYLAACAAHDVDPSLCLAVEDSPSGVAAALAAGLHVCALGEHVVADPQRLRLISHLDEVLPAADSGASDGADANSNPR